MKILVLGGTGAMGKPLVKIISQNNDVFVTTRQSIESSQQRITYLKGNAKDMSFLIPILQSELWDAIVDFMVWGTEFTRVLPKLLDNTKQYVFISSARVYAQTNDLITEKTPRLLDVSDDKVFLSTNEYALAKAREEDLLFESGHNNFTIIRPTITYNNYRLQLGVLEKENWLYRVLHGRSIVFSNDIADKVTTMTYGEDVALGISSIIGKETALSEVFNVTSPISLRWSEVLEVYLDVLEKHFGKRPKVVMTKKSIKLKFPALIYQVIYCRYFNRSFDNSKIGNYCDVTKFTPPAQGLRTCLLAFLNSPKFAGVDWKLEAYCDRASGERTPFSEMPDFKMKYQYFIIRYSLFWIPWIIYPFELGFRVVRKIYKIIH